MNLIAPLGPVLDGAFFDFARLGPVLIGAFLVLHRRDRFSAVHF